MEAVEQGRLRAGQAGLHRPGPGRHRVLRRRQEALQRGRQADRPRPQLVDFFAAWVEKYPICSIEDGFAEDDWEGWKLITERLGEKIQLVGDDLFVTNTKRLQRGIDEGIANSILIKVNQIGTLPRRSRPSSWPGATATPPSSAIAAARPKTRRSPTWPSPCGPGQIKTGSASRTDRMAKYNQLLRIEEQLGEAAQYGGPLFPNASKPTAHWVTCRHAARSAGRHVPTAGGGRAYAKQDCWAHCLPEPMRFLSKQQAGDWCRAHGILLNGLGVPAVEHLRARCNSPFHLTQANERVWSRARWAS